ncbi:MAG: peptidylprolyl isomerase [Halarcobacter sp.]
MKKKSIYLSILLTASLFANQELNFYTYKQYNQNYTKLTLEQQKQIANEYEQLKKITSLVKKDIEEKPIYKTIDNITVFEVWSKYFMNGYTPSEEKIKSLYNKTKPQTIEKYKLRNIIVKYESSADKIINKLKAIKNKKDRLPRFIKYVQQYSTDFNTINKDGDMGWVNMNLVNKTIQMQLKDKIAYDFIKVNLDNKAWEILFVEDYKPKRAATYEEVKNSLIIALKKEALSKEIRKRLANKSD